MRLEPGLISRAAAKTAVEAEAVHRRSLMPPSPLLPVLLTKPAEVADWMISQISGVFQPVPEQIVTVRKTRHAVRPVAELFIRDQLLYRTLVDAWTGRLPIATRSSEAHDAFEAAPLADSSATHIVSSDITAFYQYIDYDLLYREVLRMTGDAPRADALFELLSGLSDKKFGLPQQNSVSDVLAETYIDVLERRLIRSGMNIWRYNDDFRIATRSWPDALSVVDRLADEARRMGLALNDAKTVIRRRDRYETSISRRETLRQEIADEVELDLDGIDFGSEYGDVDVEPDPDPDEERSLGFLRIVERWRTAAEDGPHLQALVQMVPTALANLSQDSQFAADASTIGSCMEMLRREQMLTPAAAAYIEGALAVSCNLTLSHVDSLIASSPQLYLTPWQMLWLVPSLAKFPSFTSSGSDGTTRASWLRSLWDDPRVPESVRASVARPLAALNVVQTAELLEMYDHVSETSRPALAAALGASGLAPTDPQARAIIDDDDLSRWMFETGQAVP